MWRRRRFAEEPQPVCWRSPSACPHTQNGFWVREGSTLNFRALFEVSQEANPIELGVPRLPVDGGDFGLVDHHQRRQAGPYGGCEVGCLQLLDIKLSHDLFCDLPALGGSILQAPQPVLHLADAAL